MLKYRVGNPEKAKKHPGQTGRFFELGRIA
jgi:hypothetical protein